MRIIMTEVSQGGTHAFRVHPTCTRLLQVLSALPGHDTHWKVSRLSSYACSSPRLGDILPCVSPRAPPFLWSILNSAPQSGFTLYLVNALIWLFCPPGFLELGALWTVVGTAAAATRMVLNLREENSTRTSPVSLTTLSTQN